MKRALLLLSAVALLTAAVGCQAPGGHACRKCQKGLFDYEGRCEDGACGKRGGRGGGDCDDGSCDGARVGLMDRVRGRHASRRADEVGPAGPMAPQYTYPYYTTRGPRDFLLDNPPTIGY